MKNRKTIVFISIILFFLISLSFFINRFVKKPEPYYVTLYNQKELSSAITDSDKRFVKENKSKNFPALANVKSSVEKTNEPKILNIDKKNLENSTWLWTPTVFLTDEYIKEILKGARENHINKIYLAIDSYLDIYIKNDSEQKVMEKKEFDNKVSKFIKDANIYNIEVVAVSGWKNWAQKEHSYKPFVIMDYVIDFNSKRQEKFSGIQFDIEPYLLEEYKENKKETLREFISLIDEIIENAPKDNLEISIVVPEFFDKNSDSTPKFLWNGKYDFTINHLFRILSKRENSSVLIMAYRNFNTGYDGVFDISKDEILAGNKYKVKTIIALETGDFKPPFITYFNTNKKYYNQKVSEIKDYYKDQISFSGIATHYINSLMEMK